MRILIVSAGATGAFIGSRLIEKRVDVTFLVRPERRRQLITRGIMLQSPFGRFRRPVRAVVPGELEGFYDLIVLAVRAPDFGQALELSATAIGTDSIVLPVIEGIAHLLPTGNRFRPRLIAGVFEGRVNMDADGILTQRPPTAELTIGSLNDEDIAATANLVDLLSARGMKVLLSSDIRGRAWMRFGFMASAVALTVLIERSFRDARPRSHHWHRFDSLLGEARRIGEAAGFPAWTGPKLDYRHAVQLEGRPVQAPPTIADGGRAGDESAYLLAEMVGLARRLGTDVPLFSQAWLRVTEPHKVRGDAA